MVNFFLKFSLESKDGKLLHNGERGKLAVVEGAQDIPFEIKRVFYNKYMALTTRLSAESMRTRKAKFVLINVAGKSKVRITDGIGEHVVELNRPMQGIYLPKMVWKDMYDFSPDSVLLALASTHYDGNEYIRDYDEYLKIMGVKK